MIGDLAERLHDLADRLEGLPAPAAAVLEAAVAHPAVRRALRDHRILALYSLLGGAGEVYALVSGEAWRWALWQRRGVPARASAAERLAFEAWAWGPPVSRRQIERILRHAQGVQCRATPATIPGIATRRT